MSEFININQNGQWQLSKSKGPTIKMEPHSDTHMKVYHRGRTMIMPDHEAEALAERVLGKDYKGPASAKFNSPSLVEHARATGMSHSE